MGRGPGIRPLVDYAGPVVRPELGPCWLWIGAKHGSGYGLRWVNGKRVRAHRYAYQEATGHDPGEFLVCHSCDNRACVRPGHLFLGTDADNMADAKAKGRHAHGERMGGVRLTSRDVLGIRKALAAGETQRSQAAKHGVSKNTIQLIANRTNWAWLPDEP